MKKHAIALLVGMGLSLGLALCAERAAADEGSESGWSFGVALGYGERSNPLAFSDDIPILVDLDIAWFGERWFFDNGDLGITLRDDPSFTLNAIARINSDRVFFSKTDSRFVVINLTGDPDGPTASQRASVPDRDYALEFGLELLGDGDWGFVQLSVHRDVSAVHDGYELYANYGRGFREQRWYFEPSFGVSWKSARLNNYYWGVREAEANVVFPAYRAGSGLNKHIRFFTSYQLNKNWALVAVAEYERLNSAAADSPIVIDRGVSALYSGFSYRF